MMDFDFEKLMQDEEAAKDKRANLRGLGLVAESLSNVQSPHELLYGKKSPRADVRGAFDKMADSVTSESDKRSKMAKAYLENRGLIKAQDEDKQLAEAKDPSSQRSTLAKAFWAKNGFEVAPDDSEATLKIRYGDPAAFTQKKAGSQIDLENRMASEDRQFANQLKLAGVTEARNRRQSEEDFERQKELARIKAEIEKETTMAGGAREGKKAVDKDYAKDYNEWTSTGRSVVEKNLDRLERAKSLIKEQNSGISGLIPTSGRFIGRIPDIATPETNIAIRDDVRAAAQGALKATLGAQFTEKEGERIMNMAYNEKLSPEENIRKIDQAIKELRQNMDNQDSKARYFEQNGTLAGYKFNSGRRVVKTQRNKSTGQIRNIYDDGTVEVIEDSVGQR